MSSMTSVGNDNGGVQALQEGVRVVKSSAKYDGVNVALDTAVGKTNSALLREELENLWNVGGPWFLFSQLAWAGLLPLRDKDGEFGNGGELDAHVNP